MRHDFGGGDGVSKVMGGKENTKIDGGNEQETSCNLQEENIRVLL